MSATPANIPADAAHGSPPPSPPLSPLAPLRASTMERLAAAALAFACAALLGVALWLTPNSAGLGTHRQLGLKQCGFITAFDIPCPSCGMTTAFSHAVRGNLGRSFLTQPMGAILAMATAMTLVVSLYVACTGSMVAHALTSRFSARWMLVFAIIGGLAWFYKILLHRGFLPFLFS